MRLPDPQTMRFLDVFVIGPLMLLISSDSHLSKGERATLTAIGIGTILYNGYQYVQERDRATATS